MSQGSERSVRGVIILSKWRIECSCDLRQPWSRETQVCRGDTSLFARNTASVDAPFACFETPYRNPVVGPLCPFTPRLLCPYFRRGPDMSSQLPSTFYPWFLFRWVDCLLPLKGAPELLFPEDCWSCRCAVVGIGWMQNRPGGNAT